MVRDWVPVRPGLFEYPVPESGAPRLLASRCSACGGTYFPTRAMCPTCVDRTHLVPVMLDSRGVVHACTVVHVPSPVGIAPPYAYGYVDIPADGIRLFALFTGAPPETFAPGQPVELVLEPVRTDHEGRPVIGYKFRPRAT